jgi:hypothetical protein
LRADDAAARLSRPHPDAREQLTALLDNHQEICIDATLKSLLRKNTVCDCDCEECLAGDCEDCSDPDCVDPNCEGSMKTAKEELDALKNFAPSLKSLVRN